MNAPEDAFDNENVAYRVKNDMLTLAKYLYENLIFAQQFSYNVSKIMFKHFEILRYRLPEILKRLMELDEKNPKEHMLDFLKGGGIKYSNKSFVILISVYLLLSNQFID